MNTAPHLNDKLQNRIRNILSDYLINHKVKKSDIYSRMGITHSTFYKKMSGKTQFTLGDVYKLMEIVDFSFDCLVKEAPDVITFKAPGIDKVSSSVSFLDLLNDLFHNLQDMNNPHLKYVTREIPLFYYFKHPLLGAFKLFIFSKVIWRLPLYKDKLPFSIDLFSNYELKAMDDLWKKYASIPSIELWSPNIWQTTLDQIRYLLSENMFADPKDALKLFKIIKETTLDCRQMCIIGKKSYSDNKLGADIEIYNNSIMNTNNFILAGTEGNYKLLITHTNPNYLESDNDTVARNTAEWTRSLEACTIDIMGEYNDNRLDYYSNIMQDINKKERDVLEMSTMYSTRLKTQSA